MVSNRPYDSGLLLTSLKFSACSGFRLAPAGPSDMVVRGRRVLPNKCNEIIRSRASCYKDLVLNPKCNYEVDQ